MLCAIYTRLSKEDEEKHQPESESIQNQKSLLINYAVERGWDIYQIYCDEDYSGADSQRPDFNRMLKAAKEKKFQIVLCKSQSRFTRDMELVEKYIHNLFPIWGIRFIALADNADTEVKGNKKARQINGLVNEWYLEDLSENVRMVFDMKRREGKYIGSFPVYGYQKDPDDRNKLIIDPEAAEVVRQIFQWSLEGHGKQHIAAMLNDLGLPNPAKYKVEHGCDCRHLLGKDQCYWNKVTISRILRNEMYAGVMVQGRTKKVSYKSKLQTDVPKDQWYRVEGTHEAIIDKETFQAVQQQLALHTKSSGLGEVFPLAGLVKCKDCGSTMSKASNKQGRYYLRCQLYVNSGKKRRCTRHGVRLDRLIDLVSARVRQYVQTYYSLDDLDIQPRQDSHLAAMQQERKTLVAQLEKRSAALKSLYLDKVSGLLDEGQFVELNRSFLEEKRRMDQRLAQLDQELSAEAEPKERDALMDRARELLKLDPVPRELYVSLIERIEIGEADPDTGRQDVDIHWRF